MRLFIPFLLILSACPNAADQKADPVCRNGLLEAGEACDDGNGIDNDGCSNSCQISGCGDGVQHDSEACDDGNEDNADDCVEGCKVAICGDGFIRSGLEECDDANDEEQDACLNNCLANSCGDGILNLNVEFCDDGNDSDSDACSNACEPARCGDGLVQEGFEACDDGNESNDDACTNACEPASCGDGFTQPGEGCDDANDIDDDDCSNDCAGASCGDGIVQENEACDDANDDDEDGCLSTCVIASCGDGHSWAGREGCDDGNDIDSDDCTNRCSPARCGDGSLREGLEDCDDGNIENGDACTNACTLAACGDAIVQIDIEACDDGNDNNNDDCLNSCALARCGDGHVQDGVEICDDGNEVQTDACLVGCIAASCGDELIQEGVEDCDDGNADNTDLCVDGCNDAACGDGFLRDGFEDCDDGNLANGDGCNDSCGVERARVDAGQEANLGGLRSGQLTSAELSHVLVTYASASNLQERGFVLQSHPDGRALAVDVSPASLGIRAGDIIDIDIVETFETGGVRRGRSVANLQIIERNEPLDAWTHEFNNPAVIADESMAFWRVSARLTAGGLPTSAGGTYVSTAVTTAGLGGGAALQIRLHRTLQTALYLEAQCQLTVSGVPLVRYGNNNQFSPSRLSEIELHNCPPTTVTSLQALSPTSLKISFRRNLRADSVEPADFMISFDQVMPQLAISSASVEDGRFVVLTTAQQVEGRNYEFRRVGDVLDLTGRNVNVRAPAHFSGYRAPALVLINEVNANISSSCDLIEMRVTRGGILRHTVKERTTVLHRFPMVVVATGDLIVLHLNSNNSNCVQATQAGATPINETSSKDQVPSGEFAANYNNAWDHWTDDGGLTATDNVITLLLDDTIVDGVLLTKDPTGNAARDSETAARYLVAADQWTTINGDVPEGGFVDNAFRAHACMDLNGAGTPNNTMSIQRTHAQDRNHKGDWEFLGSSFGAAN
jgi:cysteine-rich repeat protein